MPGVSDIAEALPLIPGVSDIACDMYTTNSKERFFVAFFLPPCMNIMLINKAGCRFMPNKTTLWQDKFNTMQLIFRLFS